MKTNFYEFSQNNSGGHFEVDEQYLDYAYPDETYNKEEIYKKLFEL